jgi:tyrosine-protein kinase Etk/Wzc
MAANIANAARERTDYLAQNLIKDAQKKSINNITLASADQTKRVVVLTDSIKKIKNRYNIIEPSFQAKALAEEIVRTQGGLPEAIAKANYFSKYESKKDSVIKYRALAAGLERKLQELNARLKEFNKGVNELKALEQEHSRASDQYSISKEKENLLVNTYEHEFTTLHVISKAYPPVNKSRPKRSIIIIASMLIAFFAAVLGVIAMQSWSKIK